MGRRPNDRDRRSRRPRAVRRRGPCSNIASQRRRRSDARSPSARVSRSRRERRVARSRRTTCAPAALFERRRVSRQANPIASNASASAFGSWAYAFASSRYASAETMKPGSGQARRGAPPSRVHRAPSIQRLDESVRNLGIRTAAKPRTRCVVACVAMSAVSSAGGNQNRRMSSKPTSIVRTLSLGTDRPRDFGAVSGGFDMARPDHAPLPDSTAGVLRVSRDPCAQSAIRIGHRRVVAGVHQHRDAGGRHLAQRDVRITSVDVRSVRRSGRTPPRVRVRRAESPAPTASREDPPRVHRAYRVPRSDA